jgi:tripartite-type tricarboxylate transporter receptor subunit TctC
MKISRQCLIAWRLSLVLLTLAGSSIAQEAPYYKDKTIRIIAGFPSGGGVDAEARLLAKFFERHIPGNPSVLVQNMPGAGGMVATNWFEQFAKPDGLTLHYTSTTSLNQQIFGIEGAKFDLRQWPLVGSIFRQTSVGFIHPDKLARLPAPGAPLKVGVRAGDESWNAIFLWGAEFLKWNLSWVVGYAGGGEIRLAFRRNETDIFATAVLPDFTELMGDGFKPFVQQGTLTSGGSFQKRPEFPGVPTFDEMLGAKRPTGVAWQAYVSWAGSDSAGRPLHAAPKTPGDIIKTLRDAFSRLKEDKAFQADLLRVAGEDSRMLLAHEGEPILRQLLTVSPEIREYSNGLMKKYLKR